MAVEPPAVKLADSIAPLAAAHPGLSGLIALADGRDAFVARARLADAACATIDIQSYIWQRDVTGLLMFAAMRRAARRGVRVRLLLDDNNTFGLDPTLAALDAEPNVEIRLFNPFRSRHWRLLALLTDFRRLNRRMHNKSFTVDGVATIVGGRNIGDEYFGTGRNRLFVDLDALAIGAVVADVGADFERYWTCRAARRFAKVAGRIDAAQVASAAADIDAAAQLADAAALEDAVREPPLLPELFADGAAFDWAVTRMLSDDPAKVHDRARRRDLLHAQLTRVIGSPRESLALVSPYFVPGRSGTRQLVGLARQGVRVTVLTNSLAATDVSAVHAGYARWRGPLLRAGVALYEMKQSWMPGARVSRRRGRRWRERRARGRDARSDAPFAAGPHTRRNLRASSSSSLHAKTFSVDGTRVFIGSFNFDPRSARLNTEVGFLIESAKLAREIATGFADSLPEHAWRVTRGALGRLEWQGAGGVVLHSEPDAGRAQRLLVFLLAKLPIEWLL